MAKKSDTETKGKNQSESFDQKLSELRKELDSDIKKMEKMDFAEFRSEVLDHLREIHENIFIVAHRLIEEKERLDGCLDVIIEKTKERDKIFNKAFDVIRTRERGISAMVFWLACKGMSRKVTKDDRQTISEIMGYKWTAKNEKALQDYAMVQSL